jgi:superfamily II DNA or RNA helicase
MLTKRGYKVEKASLTQPEIDAIRKDLSVRPASASHHQPPAPFSVLRESSTALYLPRCYGYPKLGPPAGGSKFPPHLPIDVAFSGTLRPLQQEVVDAYLFEALNGSGSGTVVIQCGGGKTVCGIYVICELKVKTLVVVHKTFLLDQWRERINQYLPTAKLGIMKGDKFEHEGCDIVIASLQTMISRKYPLDGFGLTIYDETHHMSARVFVTSLTTETTRYTLGLTATPDRKDGLGRVFTWFIGSIVFRQDNAGMKRPDVRVQTPVLPQRDQMRCDFAGRPDTVAMITDLCNNVERNRDIADMALKVLEDPLRCLLILSERRKHLEDLYALLEPAHGPEMGYYVGGMKSEEREKVEKNARVILASVSAAAEAFDCGRLNCIILASPRSDVEQSVGRIMRTPPGVGPVAPLIIDPYDPLFAGPAKKRRALYKKRAYKIEAPPEDNDDSDGEPPQQKPMIAFKNITLS